jgi:hypothetical protein
MLLKKINGIVACGLESRQAVPGKIPYVEQLIGTVRRKCLGRMLVFGEPHSAAHPLQRTTTSSVHTAR